MGRPKLIDRATTMDRVTTLFWRRGYFSSSVEDIVAVAGVGRSALYAEFSDKRGLFLAILDAYSSGFVVEALAPLERPDAGLEAISSYFWRLAEEASRLGLPGPGCLMANAMTEVAPHDPEVAERVRAHLARLRVAFRAALANATTSGALPENTRIDGRADALVIAAQGLWSTSRLCRSGDELSAHVDAVVTTFLPEGANGYGA
jgi:TetR/AcrR family transcriptional repressor of nem operon